MVSAKRSRNGSPSDRPSDAAVPGHRATVGLAIADVAARVGVSASTLRAWERRYGVGPAGRSRGGHRRYTAADVAVLQTLRRLVRAGVPTAAAAALAVRPVTNDDTTHVIARGQDLERAQQDFAAASESLDTRWLARVAKVVLKQHGAVSAWTKVFAPRLRDLGERWAGSGEAIEREHLTAAVLQVALARHTELHLPARSRAVVLAAATHAEQHTLPLDALAAALAEAGVGTCLIGSVPASALHAATRDIAPTAVVLWARSAATSDAATLGSLMFGAPVLCAAGPGWEPARLPSGVTHLADLPAAVASLVGLTR